MKEITFWKCFFAGLWGFIVIIVGGPMITGGTGLLFIGIPLLALPWVIYLLMHSSESGEPIESDQLAASFFGGIFITMFCAIPFAVVYAILSGGF